MKENNVKHRIQSQSEREDVKGLPKKGLNNNPVQKKECIQPIISREETKTNMRQH